MSVTARARLAAAVRAALAFCGDSSRRYNITAKSSRPGFALRSGVSYLAASKTLASRIVFPFMRVSPQARPGIASDASVWVGAQPKFCFRLATSSLVGRRRRLRVAASQRFTPSRRDCTAHRSGCPATPSPHPPARCLGAAQQFSARARTAGTSIQRRRRPTGAWPWPRATRRPTRAARATKPPQTPSRRRPAMQQGNYRWMPLDGR